MSREQWIVYTNRTGEGVRIRGSFDRLESAIQHAEFLLEDFTELKLDNWEMIHDRDDFKRWKNDTEEIGIQLTRHYGQHFSLPRSTEVVISNGAGASCPFRSLGSPNTPNTRSVMSIRPAVSPAVSVAPRPSVSLRPSRPIAPLPSVSLSPSISSTASVPVAPRSSIASAPVAPRPSFSSRSPVIASDLEVVRENPFRSSLSGSDYNALFVSGLSRPL